VTAVAQVKPQVIDDEQHERVYDRVAAVDVAKDSGMVCTRTPHPSRPGARQSTVWTVKARMTVIRALGRQLKAGGIEMVTLEATSVIWGFKINDHIPAGRAVAFASATRRAKAATTRGSDQMSSVVGYLRHGRSCR
jgi:hypothetical protein